MKIIIDAMAAISPPRLPSAARCSPARNTARTSFSPGRTADILRELEKAGCKEVPQGIEIANAERSWRSATIPRRPSSRRRIPRSPWG